MRKSGLNSPESDPLNYFEGRRKTQPELTKESILAQFLVGRAAFANPLARVGGNAVRCLAITGQSSFHRSRTVLRIQDVDFPVDVRLHAIVLTEVARRSLHLHVAAVGIQNGPGTLVTRSVRPRIRTQVFWPHTRFVGPGRWRCLHHGCHLRWKPGPFDSLGHLPEASLSLERLDVRCGCKNQRSHRTNDRN